MLDGLFVADSAVSSHRPKGVWAPIFNIIAAIAAPVLTSVYLGVAEAARDLAVQKVAKKRIEADVWYLVGEMENALVTGRMAVQGIGSVRRLYVRAGYRHRERALYPQNDRLRVAAVRGREGAGNSGRGRHLPQHGLERLVRDMHAAQFHPLQTKRQHRFTGRAALGLDPAGS
jgi:hypothetical protein